MAKFLVLLGTPRDLHIPYFAMGAPRVTRELRYSARYRWRTDQDCGSPLCGMAQGQKTRKKSGWLELELYFSQTAFYATWLLFENEGTAWRSWKTFRT